MPYSRVAGLSRPYIRRVAADSRERSSASGTAVCIAAAVSKLAIRGFELRVAGVPLCVQPIQLVEKPKLGLASLGRDAAAGVFRLSTGSLPERNGVP